MRKFVSIGVHSWFLLAGVVVASPLDDRIAAFKEAGTQTEGAVSQILERGLQENRSALAFATVQPWLTANPSSSQEVLHRAAQAAERAGDWPAAASFYRKLLKSERLDAGIGAQAVPAAYRLLLNHLNDPEAAYLFMREDGDRLRGYGRARQFDTWFLEQARSRNDFVATANRLAAISNSNDPVEHLAQFEEALLSELETYRHDDERVYAALEKLAGARRSSRELRARAAWIAEIVPLSRKVAVFVGENNEFPANRLDQAVKLAAELVAVMPYRGSLIVANGWMHYNAGDSGVFMRFVEPRRDEKAAPILQALRSLPPAQARRVLGHTVQEARGRKVADYLFSRDELRALVPAIPEAFNALSAPDLALFDKSLTVEQARAMAPHLARNPHPQAALVRMWAKPERDYSAVVEALMASEAWRVTDLKELSHGVWHSGMFERDVEHDVPLKKFAKLDAQYQKLAKQVGKKASSKDRLAAFEILRKDLLGAAPRIPGSLPLWDELFANAPDEDKVPMVKTLVADLSGPRGFLLRRALAKADFGKGGRLRWEADIYDNHFRYHQSGVRTKAPELISHLEKLVRDQAKAGRIEETIFGMWVHAVDPREEGAREVMKEIAASPAYTKLDPDYRRVAADGQHFGAIALTDSMAAEKPEHLSRELLALGADATPAQVEAALQAAVGRLAEARKPVTVLGLGPVAAQETWTAPTKALVLTLFAENAPVGPVPVRQGYEPLVQRVVKEFTDAGEWAALEPYVAGLYHAAAATDDPNHYRGVAALAGFAQAALEADTPSVAMTMARSGIRSVAGRMVTNADNENVAKLGGQLRQVAGLAAVEVGAVEIPVAETDPTYPIYKSNAEFVQGNLESAWALYEKNADQLPAVLRALTVEYGLWLLQRNIEADAQDRAEQLVRELTIWSRQAEGTFSLQQDAELKIAYADLAFRKGALPTARAWYRKVADAAEYEGSAMQVKAALGSVMVDRVSRNFGAALTELDKLMQLNDPGFRKQVRYARAEVFMDQENYAEALGEVEAVLRQEPKHPDALILRGRIQYEMRKLVEASEIELGPSQDDTVLVPGEAVKINLRDPTLRVSGVGADIEVEIWAKSGDRERVLLHQLGDSKEKFRAEVPTALGPPTPGDKTLQILGGDEIRFGYSKRFRDMMDDLPPDPDLVIGVASDAHLAFSAGAFPPREGERRLSVEELGLSSAQAALGTRAVRPGNPVYLRVTDPDRSTTPGIDEVTLEVQASSGDVIRQLVLKETAPFSGEFQAIVPTSGAQALAFASESAPGRDPNMAISSRDYPGWQGMVGDKDSARIFGVDLNDNVALAEMGIEMGGEGASLTHFVLQTSMNGKDWTTRARFPAAEDVELWDGRPHLSSFPTFRGGIAVSQPEGYELPEDWKDKMELESARASVAYLAAHVPGLGVEELPFVNTGHPGYSGLIRYRACFYQPAAAIRRFQLAGLPLSNDKGPISTVFLLNGEPAAEETENPLLIERELAPGLHTIEFWRHESRSVFLERKPVLLCDEPGREELVPCPDGMFDPATFPEGVRAQIPQEATITTGEDGRLVVGFGDRTRARMVRLVIQGFEGVAPVVRKVTLADREENQLLPVAQDYMALRENLELEVLPGDQITARYEDPVTATPKRSKHEQRLTVAFNDATITASFLNYETNKEGERVLLLEPIRRFRFDDAIAVVIDDVDMDGSPQRDTIEFTVTSSGGQSVTLKAVETEEHSGRFLGRVFPVEGEPGRASEIRLEKGGTLTASYRDAENLEPGIPTDRTATFSHAVYATPLVDAYALASEELPPPAPDAPTGDGTPRSSGPEVIHPRRTLDYAHLADGDESGGPLPAFIGAGLRFDVVAPHLALAGSSEIRAYIQTDAARQAAAEAGKVFDVTVPGTLKLTGTLGGAPVEPPFGYQAGSPATPPTNEPPLEEGRFSFSVPLILGDPPNRSFATKSADELPSSALPDGLAVKEGDVVHVGFPWQDEDDEVHWKTLTFTVGSHRILDVMEKGYRDLLDSAFVGEKIYLRLLAPGLDRGPERDVTTVRLSGTSGARTDYELKETEGHSGIFKAVFAASYADEQIPAELPPVALNGFPVRYGDSITVSHEDQAHEVYVNKGADGLIEPFSKRYTGDEMAVRTSFTLAECYFELAKKHREMEQESLARREIGQARKLLAEALATHRDEELKAHAEYLLGNLAQEFADLAKNEESKLPMYQDALARFSKIPTDYPESEFASKAQFKTALVYEKMGEIENSVEEYVKLAYKYPNDELIPTVMARLGGYFQKKGQGFKEQADAIRENEDDESRAEVLRLDGLSYPEFLNAAMIFAKLQERFPDDPLAGLAGLRAAQNYMRAHLYEEAIAQFDEVIDNEQYDGPDIRAQAIYWTGLCHERMIAIMSEGNWKGRGASRQAAYQLYRRVTYDFPDSKWAKYARGRLADPVFEQIIEIEREERERMIETLKEQRR